MIYFCCVFFVLFSSADAKIVQSVLKFFGLAKDETTTEKPPPPVEPPLMDDYEDYPDYGGEFFPG